MKNSRQAAHSWCIALAACWTLSGGRNSSAAGHAPHSHTGRGTSRQRAEQSCNADLRHRAARRSRDRRGARGAEIPVPNRALGLSRNQCLHAAGNLAELGGQPIIGTYGVEPGGAVSLGPSYGRVQVAGLTLDEAADKITRQLSRTRKGIKVSVTLTASSGQQEIQGQHRVGPDGTVNLGEYGDGLRHRD